MTTENYYKLTQLGTPKRVRPEIGWQTKAELTEDERRVAEMSRNGVSVVTRFHVFSEVRGSEELHWRTTVSGGMSNGVEQKCGGNLEQALAMHENMCHLVFPVWECIEFPSFDEIREKWERKFNNGQHDY